jgi:hypothetical protein
MHATLVHFSWKFPCERLSDDEFVSGKQSNHQYLVFVGFTLSSLHPLSELYGLKQQRHRQETY